MSILTSFPILPRVPKHRFVHNIFTKKNLLKSLIKPLLPDRIRKNIHHKVLKNNLQAKPSLALETRQKLIELYREDVLKLQELIQTDLSHWLA